MNIIVVGCGKIGRAIAAAMVAEGFNVTAIDSCLPVITEFCDVYDANGIHGNGADPGTLKSAGIEDCDLFVAVTGSDELNMLSCFLARSHGAKHTIARVRDPIYTENGINELRGQLQIDDIINPERYAAKELFHMLQLPAAAKIETFSGRSFEMVEISLRADSPLDGLRLCELRGKFGCNVLICAVVRGNELFIPDGNFVLQTGDRLGVTGAPTDMERLFKSMGVSKRQAHSIMILGGSRTAYYLAKRLNNVGCQVKIIEKDHDICQNLCEILPKSVIIEGDGIRKELLREEGINTVDAFVALSGMDEENILISIFAESQGASRVIAKVNRADFEQIARGLGLDSVVSPKRIITDVLVHRARAFSNAGEIDDMESLYTFMDGMAEAMEFRVGENKKLINIPLRDLRLKSNILLAGIIRGRKTCIPDGDSVLVPGDKVIVLSRKDRRLRQLSDILD